MRGVYERDASRRGTNRHAARDPASDVVVEAKTDGHVEETTGKPRLRTVSASMDDVTQLRWPSERRAREALARRGRARLLIVDQGAPPPVAADPLEDWVRERSSELDVRARLEGLRLRLEQALELVPDLDDDGVIRFGER